jgi:isopenicillin-N N-acyltransferase like protein
MLGVQGAEQKLRVIELYGTPKAMGEGFGEVCRAQIQEFYHLRVLNALTQAKQYGGRKVDEGVLLEVARRSLSVSESYHPEGFAELVGIARAAHLSVEQAFAMNGLTDLRDVLAYWSGVPGLSKRGVDGCSSFVVMGDRTSDGRILCGQSWDLATDNMPYVIGVHRKPKDAPETWCLTTVGCLSLIGMNAEGIAIGTTNIRSKDSRPGICYLSLIHKALSQGTFQAATACIETLHRAAAHYYWIVSAKERLAAGIECTATRHERTEIDHGHYVHCNHMTKEANKPLEAVPPKSEESTVCRQDRLSELLAKAPAIDEAAMRGFLADHEQGEQAICRHDFAGISSNGAVVMSPEVPRVWACQGQPCKATWLDLYAA